MKRLVISGIIVFVVALLASQITQAQGTIYLSNLGQPSTGSHAVGSDSWLAVPFATGTNTGGYMLNYLQLGMADASGDPSGFTAMLYGDGNFPGGNSLGSNLCTLAGSASPVTGGIYTYAASDLTLSPSTLYSIVLTAETPLADGAYQWGFADTFSYNPSDGWSGGGGLLTSSDGLSWHPPTTGNLLYAINATAVPEPGVLGLFGLGGVFLAWHRRRATAVS